MSKYQALIDALEAPGLSDCPWVAFGPSNDAAPPDYYNEVVAVRGDAQVQVICHAPRGLDGACTADTTYIAEANPATIRALLADLEMAEKALAALAQQAQEPVSHDMHRWCAYVGGMVAHWVMSEPNAHVRLGDDQFEVAIAGIIERRLWAMPKRDTTPQPAPLAAYAPNDALPPKGDSVTKIVPDVAPTRDYLPGMWDESDLLGGATDMPSKPAAPLAGEVTDDLVRETIKAIQDPDTVDAFYNGYYTLTPDELRRTILALRPQAVPMTDGQIVQGQGEQGAQSILSFMKGIRYAEAHHGITAPAGGEG